MYLAVTTLSKAQILSSFTLLLAINGILLVSSQEFAPCFLCKGDATATITNPDGIIDLSFLNIGITEALCKDMFDAGIEGFIPPDLCSQVVTEGIEIQQICGCTYSSSTPGTTPTSPVPAPVPGVPVTPPGTGTTPTEPIPPGPAPGTGPAPAPGPAPNTPTVTPTDDDYFYQPPSPGSTNRPPRTRQTLPPALKGQLQQGAKALFLFLITHAIQHAITDGVDQSNGGNNNYHQHPSHNSKGSKKGGKGSKKTQSVLTSSTDSTGTGGAKTLLGQMIANKQEQYQQNHASPPMTIRDKIASHFMSRTASKPAGTTRTSTKKSLRHGNKPTLPPAHQLDQQQEQNNNNHNHDNNNHTNHNDQHNSNKKNHNHQI